MYYSIYNICVHCVYNAVCASRDIAIREDMHWTYIYGDAATTLAS